MATINFKHPRHTAQRPQCVALVPGLGFHMLFSLLILPAYSSPIFTLCSWPWFLFHWENRNNPQVPTNTSTRPLASGPYMLLFLLLPGMNCPMFPSKAEASTRSLDPTPFTTRYFSHLCCPPATSSYFHSSLQPFLWRIIYTHISEPYSTILSRTPFSQAFASSKHQNCSPSMVSTLLIRWSIPLCDSSVIFNTIVHFLLLGILH